MILLAAMGGCALRWFHANGFTLYYGDAQAHLNIARRMIDSRTPGYEQVGTVWLPLPHLLMIPLAGNDDLWRTGLAGAIPSCAAFIAAGLFLFGAVRRALGSAAAAFAATLLFATNPNLLYLQSTPMTEPLFFAGLLGLVYFIVLFAQTQSFAALAGAIVFSNVASLTRYDGWFLIPFATLAILWCARRARFACAVVFGLCASAGPLYWLAHNYWYYSDALEFYRGQYSAKAIYQRALDAGMAKYPGDGEWDKAWLYFRSAAASCAGPVLLWLGAAGAAAALWKRSFWPLLLLLLVPVFYVLSLYSSGTPIFVPYLWPNSWYNTRYGLAALPLLAFAAAALVAAVPPRVRAFAAGAVVLAAASPWLAYPRAESWICWKESQVNSEARRAWTREAADYLRVRYKPHSGILTSFGDLAGIYPLAGIPLRETLHEGNDPFWTAALARPDLFLREEWVVALGGDQVSSAMAKAGRWNVRYALVNTITVKGGPVIEIYRRNR